MSPETRRFPYKARKNKYYITFPWRPKQNNKRKSAFSNRDRLHNVSQERRVFRSMLMLFSTDSGTLSGSYFSLMIQNPVILEDLELCLDTN